MSQSWAKFGEKGYGVVWLFPVKRLLDEFRFVAKLISELEERIPLVSINPYFRATEGCVFFTETKDLTR